MMTNIFKYQFIHRNGSKWYKMAKYGPKWYKLTKNGENGQNSPKQWGTNILIFEYILVYLGVYNHSQKISLIFSRANLFGYSFLINFS